MPLIVIYTKSTCPYCHSAKDLLKGKGAAFDEISVDGDWAGQMTMAEKAGGVRPFPRSLSPRSMSVAATIFSISMPRASSTSCWRTEAMIKYALGCAEGHTFDSWFPDSGAYDSQRKRGLIACPECGSTKVEKGVMAPAVLGGPATRMRPVGGPAGRSRDGRPPPADARDGLPAQA